MKQYRLLRNNKETGPYTAGQLIELGFKPYDLVWADGKSAAWRYPCEMDEFKAYAPAVEEQPFDRFFRKPGAAAKPQTATVTVQAPVQTATPQPVGGKPRIRIKADWNQVEQTATETRQTVTNPQVKPLPQAQAKQQANTGTAWQNAWLDWQQEQKVAENASKNNETNAADYVPAQIKGPAIETKFSQSLNGLKQQYAENFVKAKGKMAEGWFKYKMPATLILLAIPVLGLGIWLGGSMHSDNGTNAKKTPITTAAVLPAADITNGTQQTSGNNNNAQAGIAENTATSQPAAPKTKTGSKELIPGFDDNTSNQPSQETVKKTAAPVRSQPAPVEKKYAVQPLQQANTVAVTKQQNTVAAPPQRYNFTAPAGTSPAARNKVINPALNITSGNTEPVNNSNTLSQNTQKAAQQQYIAPIKTTAPPAPVFSHISKQQKIEDFVSVEGDQPEGQSVQNLALNVENVTDALVNLVVIDVQYFDTNGRFKTGQTIYVKNIPENETVKVKIPDNASASRIKYKVSLVSVEQKGVYLVAE